MMSVKNQSTLPDIQSVSWQGTPFITGSGLSVTDGDEHVGTVGVCVLYDGKIVRSFSSF